MRQNISTYEVILLVVNLLIGLAIAMTCDAIGLDGGNVACVWFVGLYVGGVITKG